MMRLKHSATPDLCDSEYDSKCKKMSSGPQQYVDELLEIAKVRWLKVPEIEYLLDPKTTPLSVLGKPPCVRPKSGTVFLFDRNVTTNYKEDGYHWIKKRNSPKVREDHVKLRTNGEYRVAGIYSHCSNPVSLHRRAYHLLDPTTGATRSPVMKKTKKNGGSFNVNAAPSLVLVHYLDTVKAAECARGSVVEGRRQRRGKNADGKRELASIGGPAMKKSKIQSVSSCHSATLLQNEMEGNDWSASSEQVRGCMNACYPSSPVAVTSAHIVEETKSAPVRNVEKETFTSYLEKVSSQMIPEVVLSHAYPENKINSNDVSSMGELVSEASDDEEYDQPCNDELFDGLWDFLIDSNVNVGDIFENGDDYESSNSVNMTLTPEFLGDLDYIFD